MTKLVPQSDQLFQIAEQLSQEFSLFPDKGAKDINVEDSHRHIRGLLTQEDILQKIESLSQLDNDQYIQTVVSPSENKNRPGAKTEILKIARKILDSVEDGPFYSAEIEIQTGSGPRRIGVIAQNREFDNGVWGPKHHKAAAHQVRHFCRHKIPVVSFIDTPGADAGEEANGQNQAHSISRLIAEMTQMDVPTVGIIIGAGYSGGAIPLAASNVLLSVRDGIFNTIQPQGLAAISRKFNLTWQECAQYVGVSAFELIQLNIIDGIIDYVPGEKDQLSNLSEAIVSAIESIESSSESFVREHPYLLDHYQNSIARYLNPSDKLRAFQKESPLSLAKTPTEHLNIFGLTYRYMRYLANRKRIQCTTVGQYGRLSEQEVLPSGQLQAKQEEEIKRNFQSWLQAPDKIIYDEQLNKSWKNYLNRLEDRDVERGYIGRLFLGEPESNYAEAKQSFCFELGLYLFNRWKKDAPIHFKELLKYLEKDEQSRFLLRSEDITNPKAFAEFVKANDHVLAKYLRERLDQTTQSELAEYVNSGQNQQQAIASLVGNINSIISQESFPKDIQEQVNLTESTKQLFNNVIDLKVEANRRLLENALSPIITPKSEELSIEDLKQATVLDAILTDDLHPEFVDVCHHMLVFGHLYDDIINNLITIAKEAHETHSLSSDCVDKLLQEALENAVKGQTHSDALKTSFGHWLTFFGKSSKREAFLLSLEEWKKAAYPRLSDSLFVIITFFFDKLLPRYFEAEEKGKDYDGRINPSNIGRRKDFWNRLTIAYNDILIQDVLDDLKQSKVSNSDSIIDRFFADFTELYGDYMSADPVSFPGFRSAIEKALDKGKPACGVITGIGTVKVDGQQRQVGALISNLDFQAGAFDMASAIKFCRLMVECAKRNLPIVCFVSSGGMQTKEGAAALFSMAIVNDRITRFVRDHDLPIVVFGFGDCTGGAQASFVTHPMVQNYYFSGTNMPFAGQIVVPSYLPSTTTLSNYLSSNPESMVGLVKHPFAPELDEKLRGIDPEIPIAHYQVEDVLERILEGVISAPVHQVEEIQSLPKEKLYSPVNKILIHARGCTAIKLIRVAQAHGRQVVLVQSDPDMKSAAVDALGENDRVVCIGGNTPDESYLNAKSVMRVARLEQVDALHPGIGFLSENSQFAALVASQGVNFVGPSVQAMETMGNKSNAIKTATDAGVPTVPGSQGILTSSVNAAAMATTIGYPVLLKAVHGGGGKGIMVVESPDQIHERFHTIAAEAKSAFGSGDVYMEKFVTSMRHIEVQVLRDRHGNTRVLGLRDCTVQRNNQKIIEESGSTMLSKALEKEVLEYAAQISDQVEYIGAGTVEFIYDLLNEKIYFMEMNTRLQVEHPVTEWVSGVNIVNEQFRIAEGESIAKVKAKKSGYAMELRITAEKAIRTDKGFDFQPNPGKIEECHFPENKHMDIVSAAASGKEVSPFYDSMIVQLICHGKDRNDTIKKLRSYLDDVVVTGICTNIPMLKAILDDEVFQTGVYDTSYLLSFYDRVDMDALIAEIEETGAVHDGGISLETISIDGSEELKVISPSSSIFYSSSSPSEPSFVHEGDIITSDQTLCLMEAMKVFTPFTLNHLNQPNSILFPANRQYKVTHIQNADGQQVNRGDLLFVVKPFEASDSLSD